jgi:hypothetical protein
MLLAALTDTDGWRLMAIPAHHQILPGNHRPLKPVPDGSFWVVCACARDKPRQPRYLWHQLCRSIPRGGMGWRCQAERKWETHIRLTTNDVIQKEPMPPTALV